MARKHDPATQEWLDARTDVLRASEAIRRAVARRPRFGTAGWDEYQQTVMAPLIMARTVARLKAERARQALQVERQAVQS